MKFVCICHKLRFGHLRQILTSFPRVIMTFAQSLTQASSPETSSHVTDELQTLQPACVGEKYEFLQKLGKGSQGNVWQAKSRSHGELVAIKQLHVHSVTTWKQYELFKREAETLASLEIDGVVPFREYIEDLEANPPYVCIVQKFVEGQTLAEMLKKKHRFETETIYDIITQVLKILQNLHEHRPAVIHRDIKPSNLMLTLREDGKYRVTLLDFGAVANPQVQNGGSTVAGTFGYMPPEQLMGQAGPASDIYALAAVAVELLSGTSPADIEVCDFKLVIEPYLTHVDQAVVQTLCLMLEPSLQNRLCDYNALIAQFSNLAHKEEISFLNFFKNDKIPKLEDVQSICQPGNYELWQNFNSEEVGNVEKYITKVSNKHRAKVFHYKCYFDFYINKLDTSYKPSKLCADEMYLLKLLDKSNVVEHSNTTNSLTFHDIILKFICTISGIMGIFFAFVEAVGLSGALIFSLIIASVLFLALILMFKSHDPSSKARIHFLDATDDDIKFVIGTHEYHPPFDIEHIKALLYASQKVIARIVNIEYQPTVNPMVDWEKFYKEESACLFAKGLPCFKITYQYRCPKGTLNHIVTKDLQPVSHQVKDTILYDLDFYGEAIVHTSPESHYKIGDLIPLLFCIQEQEEDMLGMHTMPYPFPFANVQNPIEACDTMIITWDMIRCQNRESLMRKVSQLSQSRVSKLKANSKKWNDWLIRLGYPMNTK